jgi:hypothetical protein
MLRLCYLGGNGHNRRKRTPFLDRLKRWASKVKRHWMAVALVSTVGVAGATFGAAKNAGEFIKNTFFPAPMRRRACTRLSQRNFEVSGDQVRNVFFLSCLRTASLTGSRTIMRHALTTFAFDSKRTFVGAGAR